MKDVNIKQWSVETSDYTFRCYWYPGEHLGEDQLSKLMDDINYVNEHGIKLQYGFFNPALPYDEKLTFLKNTIWCITYQNNEPCGIVYQYDLGEVLDRRIIHFGLIKFNHHPGKDFIRMPYNALGLGNLINFGSHYATNISHLPAIIDMFGDMVHDIYPHYSNQDQKLRHEYKQVLTHLVESYIIPILDYDHSWVCERTYRIKGSLKNSDAGFETDWRTVPKSQDTICNLFVKDWLTIKEDPSGRLNIEDDLIQIGKVDFRYLGNPKMHVMLNQAKFVKIEEDLEEHIAQILPFSA